MISPYFNYFKSLILGASLTLAYAPYSHWYIVPFILAAFLTQLEKTDNSAFKISWCFGLGWFGAGISWVHVSIANFGGLPLIASLALMALLCGYLALFPAIAFLTIKKHAKPKQWWWLLPAIWFVTEWLRGWFMTGFPWLSLGYSQTSGPMAHLAPIIGETGISALIIGFSAFLFHQWKQKQRQNALVGISLIFGLSVLSGQIQWTENTDRKFNITMVQGNIEQELRWVPEQDIPTMHKYLDLTEPYWNSDIIIWPEAAVPRIEPLAVQYLSNLDKQAFATQTGLITGIVNYNFETRDAFNSLISIGATNDIPDEGDNGSYRYFHPNRYSKHHLLPIGEFIPLENWLRGLAPIFDLPMSSFSRGDYQQANLETNGAYLAPAICFEIAFPQQVRANLNSKTDFIITVSNDAWFGNSHGPHQHLEIAQMRAIELGMPVLRSTNNGITAFINAQGKIISSAPQFQATAVSATLAKTSGITPYRYFGDFPLWVLTLSALIFFLRNLYLQKNQIATKDI